MTQRDEQSDGKNDNFESHFFHDQTFGLEGEKNLTCLAGKKFVRKSFYLPNCILFQR